MVQPVPYQALRDLYLSVYEHHFPLSDDTITDVVRNIPSSVEAEALDDYVLKEMNSRAKALGRVAYRGNSLAFPK